jgi:hypothetical protein
MLRVTAHASNLAIFAFDDDAAAGPAITAGGFCLVFHDIAPVPEIATAMPLNKISGLDEGTRCVMFEAPRFGALVCLEASDWGSAI